MQRRFGSSLTRSPRYWRATGTLVAAGLAACGLTGVSGQALAQDPNLPGPGQGRMAEAAPVSEDHLLRAACAYLRLSRQQLSSLLTLARQAERRRYVHQVDEQRVRRFLQNAGAPVKPPEAPETPEPPDVTAARQLLAESRSRLETDVAGGTAPQLARIFTREQVALAWRLASGEPPRYADADPALLTETAGFASGLQARTRSLRMRVLEEGARLQRLQREVPRSGDGASPEGHAAEAELEVLRAQALQLRELERQHAEAGQAIAGDIEVLTLLRGSERGLHLETGGRPFAQWVVETVDPLQLAPAVEPLARRLFMSDRLAPVLQQLLNQGWDGRRAAGASAVSLNPSAVVRDYRMERGLADLKGRGPELEPLGGELARGQYLFGPGQGLRLEDAGVTDHYALQVIFRYFGAGGYQKILDFKDRKQDGGLYFYQGHLTFYTLANGGIPVPGQLHRLRLERSRATRIVRAYLDWRPVFAFIDLDDEAVFDGGKCRLFLDDEATKNEQGPGAFGGLMVWASR